MSLTVAAISGVVAAAVKYLLASKGMQLAAEKAVEKIGTMGGEALVNAGKNALAKLRTALAERGEAAKKAKTALNNLGEDPQDEDYQRKLITELDKLSANDTALRKLLEELSADVQQAGGTTTEIRGSVNAYDNAKIDQGIGVNTGTATYNAAPDDSEQGKS